MNKIYALEEDELRGEIYQRVLRLVGKNWGTWESAVAAVALFGGLLSIVLGILDWAVVGLFAPAGAVGKSLDVAGTTLFVLPLPLLALGAYCLDLLEKKPLHDPARRREPGRVKPPAGRISALNRLGNTMTLTRVTSSSEIAWLGREKTRTDARQIRPAAPGAPASG